MCSLAILLIKTIGGTMFGLLIIGHIYYVVDGAVHPNAHRYEVGSADEQAEHMLFIATWPLIAGFDLDCWLKGDILTPIKEDTVQPASE